MPADNEMTIIIRARDETARAISSVRSTIAGVGGAIGKGMALPLQLVGRLVDGIYKRFFSIRTLLAGGGVIAAFVGVLTKVTPNATLFEAFFSPQQQGRLNATRSAWSALGATITNVFGNIIGNNAESIQRLLEGIGKWFINHQSDIEGFFRGVANAVVTMKKVLFDLLLTMGDISNTVFGRNTDTKHRDFTPRPLTPEESARLHASEGAQSGQDKKDFEDAQRKARAAAGGIREVHDAIEDTSASLRHFLIELREVSNILAGDATNALLAFAQGTRTAAQAFGDMVRSMLADLGRLLLNAGFQRLFGSLLGVSGLGGLLGFVGNSNPGFGEVGHIIPGRQSGGPVTQGRPYVVGERGPELFIPGKSGRIGHGGGSGSVVVNNHFHGPANPQAVEKATLSAVMRGLETNVGFRKKVRAAT